MIVDKVKIFIKAGNGGDGAVSLHREKYVNAGGPDGGDGGNGGNIVFQADPELRTLMDFRYHQKFVAAAGENGKKKNMRGKNGEDLIIKVPEGTVIIDEETGKIAADMRPGSSRILLRGGAGGKGNARFATATRQTPRFATPGYKTQGRYVILELKSIADVGLIGFPNVGKSTMLSVLTSARPKIANYHFTTIRPNLGVVQQDDYSFIMADIPGLIEGASQGAGLGHDFLRHIERTRMLVHVIDISGMEGRNPIEDYQKIRGELSSYSPALLQKPEIVAANKCDLPGSEENLHQLQEYLAPQGIDVFPISAATKQGISQLLYRIIDILKTLPEEKFLEEEGVIEEWEMSESKLDYDIYRDEDGVVCVDGSLIRDIFAKIDPNEPDSMRHFQKLLVDFGIIKELRKFGVQDGDTVRMEDLEFDFID